MIHFLQKQQLHDDFESQYLLARNKEDRVITIDQIKELPYPDSTDPHYNEWKLRQISFKRFKQYLESKSYVSLLDIACGNGWFMNRMLPLIPNIAGIDINLFELNQADTLLKGKENINLFYGNITEVNVGQKFELITILAGAQYFESLTGLINSALKHLTKDGELHIFDSPFYKTEKATEIAKQNSKQYYESIDQPQLGNYYHHLTYTELSKFDYQLLYNPSTLSNKTKKILGKQVNPFPWIRIKA